MGSQMLELENNTRYIPHIYSNGERERDRERENDQPGTRGKKTFLLFCGGFLPRSIQSEHL